MLLRIQLSVADPEPEYMWSVSQPVRAAEDQLSVA